MGDYLTVRGCCLWLVVSGFSPPARGASEREHYGARWPQHGPEHGLVSGRESLPPSSLSTSPSLSLSLSLSLSPPPLREYLHRQ